MIARWRPFFYNSIPPNDDERVRVRLRSGHELSGQAGYFFWPPRNSQSDIVQYRDEIKKEIKYNAATWTPWTGEGEIPTGICNVMLRDGTLMCGDSRQLDWTKEHKHKLNYITAYKVIDPVTDDFLP